MARGRGANVQHFDKPKRVAERDKLLGIRPVEQIVLMKYADDTGLVDERICLYFDEKTVVALPLMTTNTLKDDALKQFVQRLNVVTMNAKPQLSGVDILPIKAKPPEEKTEEKTGE